MVRSSWLRTLLATACGCAGAWPLLPAHDAHAADGAAILAGVDAAATQAKDLTGTLKLTVLDPTGQRAERTLKLWQKGTDRRMAKFEAPPTVRGVGLLANGSEGTFLYLPEFGRARRIVGRSRGDSFFGTDFTNDDMARVLYADRFSAELQGEDKEIWRLTLTPKIPDDEPWHHMEVQVRRADHVVTQLEFFDTADGSAVRRIEAGDIRLHGSQAVAHKIHAFDLKTGRETLAVLEDVHVDTGLEDGFFTKRHLMREGSGR